jgi:hypothetical protein
VKDLYPFKIIFVRDLQAEKGLLSPDGHVEGTSAGREREREREQYNKVYNSITLNTFY